MGSYVTLNVGRASFTWKSFVPASIAFLFQADDLVCEWEWDGFDGYPEKLGFRTTRGKVSERLAAYGFGDAQICDLYREFYPQLQQAVVGNLLYEVEAGYVQFSEEVAHQKLVKLLPRGEITAGEAEADLEQFRTWLAQYFGEGGRRRRAKVVHGHLVPVNYDDLCSAFQGKGWRTSPALLRWVEFLDEDNFREYSEVVELAFLSVLAGIGDPDDEVSVDLADILSQWTDVYDREDWMRVALEVLDELPGSLASKISRYNSFFQRISFSDANALMRYHKARARDILRQLPFAETANDKGKALEDLMVEVFSSHPGLKILERRLNTGDEELDLVIKNGVRDAFWEAFVSPMMFVECKNWSSPVGASEFRDFAMKVENHAPACRIGVFVAANGFTSQFHEARRRGAGGQYTVLPITVADIEEFVDGDSLVTDWLGKVLGRSP